MPSIHLFLLSGGCQSAGAGPSTFSLSLIDMSLFKDRVVAMGKPHCNYSIWTFGSCTRFNVNFAYAEFHSCASFHWPYETPVPELVEGALPKPYIYTVAYASGSERCVFWFRVFLLFRVSAYVFSVFFRVIPWLILPLLSFHHSLANLLLLLRLTFVANLLLCLCLPCDFTNYLQK